MLQLFDRPWTELTLGSVSRFLESAGAEPLLWEAKGTLLSSKEIRRQCGGFANSEEGGYLILGAAEDGEAWVLDGVAFAEGEPHRHITDCLKHGVRPLPTYDVHAFKAAAGHVAVVKIEPLDAGPCIVAGTVHERVPGATIAVTDPGRLAALFARGDRARAAAKLAAEGAARETHEVWAAGMARRPGTLIVSVGVGPIRAGQDGDVRLFRASTERAMVQLIEPLAASGTPLEPTITSNVAQDRRTITVIPVEPHRPSWALAGFWDGATATASCSAQGGAVQSIVAYLVGKGAAAAIALADCLGGGQTGYLHVVVAGGGQERWREGVDLRRGPLELAAIESELPSLRRELQRTLGVDEAEPEA